MACLPTILEDINAAAFLLVSTLSLQEIEHATKSDKAVEILKNVIITGWSEHCSQVPSQILSVRDKLTIQDVIPVSLQCDMKQKLLASHLSAESCL